MRYRRLGIAGIKVSEVSLGSWRTFGKSVDQETTEACMVEAYENGVNYFDGAEIYALGAAEQAMGKVFRKQKWARDTLVISSKVNKIGDKPNQGGLSRKHLVEECDAALMRMGLDYLDLFFCHRPDPETPMEETVAAMDELIKRGKILYWGTSNFSEGEIMELFGIAEAGNYQPPTMEQPKYNMLHRDGVEKELARPVQKKGLGLTVFSPLQVGFLSGKYNNGIPEDSHFGRMDPERRKKFISEEKLEKCRKLGDVARDLGMAQASLALAWCLKNKAVSTVLTGASKPEQVKQNVKASEDADLLTEDVMGRIEQILSYSP
ncbi:MAG: aldo/keto reductase [Verrucomicrobiota bacterium]